jgi:hypothetical protein
MDEGKNAGNTIRWMVDGGGNRVVHGQEKIEILSGPRKKPSDAMRAGETADGRRQTTADDGKAAGSESNATSKWC